MITLPRASSGTQAVAYWSSLITDDDAVFDAEVIIDADALTPFVTWGTNPGQGLPLSASVPDPELIDDDNERSAAERALAYMGLTAGTPLRQIHVDTVFLGSCTNGRIEDLRAAADMLRGRHIDPTLRMLVVPGSMRVKAQAEAEGLDAVFTAAGAEWRQRRLLDVPGDEPRSAGARRAQRVDLEPQLRGPAGQGRPHPPGLAAGGRRHRRAWNPVVSGGSRPGTGLAGATS